MPNFPTGPIYQALSYHIYAAHLARQYAIRGSLFPPFKAIFKAQKSPENIGAVFSAMGNLNAFSVGHGRPEFVCARTKEEASQYASYIPDLWQRCTKPGALTSAVSFVTKGEGDNLLFLCPGFWSLADDDVLKPRPETCPLVRENRWVDNENPGTPRLGGAKSTAVSAFAAEVYVKGNGRSGVFPQWTEYVERLNEVLGWDGGRAVSEPWSFQVFIECKLWCDRSKI